jgi:peptidyl-prolyl cis-trans isomerase C
LSHRSQAGRRDAPRLAVVSLVAWAAVVVGPGCGSCGRSERIAGRYDGGVVTDEELRREADKLPPVLRSRFESGAGRREMIGAIIDKRLLAAEAIRRDLDDLPEVRREVEELEERLVIQALLAAEERAMGAPTEGELREWYEGHRGELGEPERVRLRRVLAVAPAGSGPVERTRARARAERFAARLAGGERFEKVALDGDGKERGAGGDIGLVARNLSGEPALVTAAFALARPGERTPVVEVSEGYAVFELVERRAGRTPSFDEARAEVANRVTPLRKRKAFDTLLARLRERADVRLEAQGSK